MRDCGNVTVDSRSVLISIRPKWVEQIASGKKTLEIRKTIPNVGLPFVCYIYCSHGGHDDVVSMESSKALEEWSGKVIGEFVCDGMERYRPVEHFKETMLCLRLEQEAGISAKDIWAYSDNGKKILYGWHISNLKIYGKPLKLSDFLPVNRKSTWIQPIHRAPQSWMYVNRAYR